MVQKPNHVLYNYHKNNNLINKRMYKFIPGGNCSWGDNSVYLSLIFTKDEKICCFGKKVQT
jgi:hypothetical protein